MELTSTQISEVDALKSTMVETIRFLHGKGWAPATSSNYSFRNEAASDFWISASGIDKGMFTEADFIHVDASGAAIDDTRKTSAETLLHVMLYDRLPDVRCVLHSHSVFNTVWSMAKSKKGHFDLEGYEILKGLKGVKTHDVRIKIPIFENSQDIAKLSNEIGKWMDKHDEPVAFLLSGHGLYTWGEDIAAAKRQMEVLEFLFEVAYKIKTLNLL